MWMDIAIGIIIFSAVILGYIRGFVNTFIHTVGWLLSVVLAFVWHPAVTLFLKEKTDFYDLMLKTLTDRLATNTAEAAERTLSGLPSVLSEVVDAATGPVSDALAQNLTNFLFSTVGFLLVLIGIKLIFLLLTSLFSKGSNDGLTGWLDGIFGAVFGGVKGLILVLFLLALLVPISSLSGAAFLQDTLDASRFAQILYDNNYMLLLIKSFL